MEEEDDEEATPFPAERMASTTAEPPPFGDADYVLALQWEGSYQTTDGRAFDNAADANWHQYKLRRLAEK